MKPNSKPIRKIVPGCADCGNSLRSHWLCDTCKKSPYNQDWFTPDARIEKPLFAEPQQITPHADLISSGDYELVQAILAMSKARHLVYVKVKRGRGVAFHKERRWALYTIEQIATAFGVRREYLLKIWKANGLRRKR